MLEAYTVPAAPEKRRAHALRAPFGKRIRVALSVLIPLGCAGFSFGAASFPYFFPTKPLSWSWRGGIAAALLTILIASAAWDLRPRLFLRPRLLFLKYTRGGWFWQQSEGWWTPFFISFAPIAAFSFSFCALAWFSSPRSGAVDPSGRILQFGWAFLRQTVMWFPLMLLACYGLRLRRKWVRYLGVGFIGAGVVGALLVIRNLFMRHAGGMPFVDTSSPGIPYLLAFLLLLYLLFLVSVYRFFFAARKADVPPSDPRARPWRGFDIPVVVFVPQLLLVAIQLLGFLENHQRSVLFAWTPLLTCLLALIFAGIRVGLREFFGGFPEHLDLRERASVLLPYAAIALFMSMCLRPSLLWSTLRFSFALRASLQTLLVWGVLLPFVSAVIYQGILLDYFRRSFGDAAGIVFVGLWAGLGRVADVSPLSFPGDLVAQLIISFTLTFLRVRTGSLMACVLLNAFLNLLLEIRPTIPV